MPRRQIADYYPTFDRVLEWIETMDLKTPRYPDDQQVREEDGLRVRVGWLNPNYDVNATDPNERPLLEIVVTTPNARRIWVYRDEPGARCHPLYRGWRWHVW
jgi:hypothetical protein